MRFVQGNSKKNMANAMTGQTFIRPGIIKVPWHLAVAVICISTRVVIRRFFVTGLDKNCRNSNMLLGE